MRAFKLGFGFRTFLFIERLKKDIKGTAAIEFAIIAPILILLFVGTYEISTAVSVNRKLARVSSTVGDLITQSTSLSESELEDIVKASVLIMKPYSTPLKIQINSITIDAVDAKIDQSFAYDVTGGIVTIDSSNVLAPNTVYTVPTKIKTDGSYLLAAAITATHVPTIGFLGYGSGGLTNDTTGIEMEQEIFLRPRIGRSICIGSTC